MKRYEGDRSGTEHITAEDTLDLDYGLVLERAYAAAARIGKRVASPKGLEPVLSPRWSPAADVSDATANFSGRPDREFGVSATMKKYRLKSSNTWSTHSGVPAAGPSWEPVKLPRARWWPSRPLAPVRMREYADADKAFLLISSQGGSREDSSHPY